MDTDTEKGQYAVPPEPLREPIFVRGDTITVCPDLMEVGKDYAVLFAGQVYIYRKTSESEVVVYVEVG